MDEITTQELQEIRPALFEQFIAYIDRTEITTKTYITHLRQFVAWLIKEGIRQPTREDIISYKGYLSSEHWAIALDPNGWAYRLRNGSRYKIKLKPATVAQYLRAVRQFFRWTASAGLYPNVADNIHTPRIRTDFHRRDALTPEEVQEIGQNILDSIVYGDPIKEEQGRRLYCMFILAVTAGLRTIELSRANVKDLGERGGKPYLMVWGKGHTEPDTRKPIAKEVYKALREYLEMRKALPSDPLFVATGNRSGGQRLLAATIGEHLKRAMQAAGYDSERLTAHSLRHTAGTAVQELTGDIYTTQKYMRHQNPATTEIYLHIKTETKEAEVAEQLFALFTGEA